MESLSFYLNLLRYPFFKAGSHHVPMLSALLVISQVSTAMGFLVEWMNHRKEKYLASQ